MPFSNQLVSLFIVSSTNYALFQIESFVQKLSSEIEFSLHKNGPVGGTHLRTKTRFDTEAKDDDSGMAYTIVAYHKRHDFPVGVS